MRHLTIFFLLGCVLSLPLLQKCDLPEGGPGWEPNYYGPIANTRVDIEDIAKLEDLVFNQEVDANDVKSRFEGEVPEVPPFSLDKQVGPYPFTITEIFEKIAVDSLLFNVSFENAFPIDIAKGTVISFRNKDDGKEVFRHRIQADVEPGEKFEVTRTVLDESVDNDLNFYLENFTSNGSQEPVDFGDGLETDFRFELIFLSIAELEIKTNQSYRITDTTSFDLDTRDEAGSAKGELFIYFENRYPLIFETQLYLLDENKNLVDSLFESPVELGSAPVVESPQGGRITGDTVLVVDTVELKDDNLRSLKNADYLSGNFFARTVDTAQNGNPLSSISITITDRSFLNLQVTGDVKGVAN